MPTNVKIAAILVAKPNRAGEWKALLLQMAPLCRAEAGNLQWDLWQNHANSDSYLLDEMYADDAAVVAHHQTAHYKHYLAVIPGLAERTAVVLKPFFVAPASVSRERFNKEATNDRPDYRA